jgi:hypothetical protein
MSWQEILKNAYISGFGVLLMVAALLVFTTPQPVNSEAYNETTTFCNVSVNYIIDVSISNVPVIFDSLNPGTSDNQPTSGGWPVNVTVHSNTNTAWNLSVKASGDFSGPDTLSISNLEFGNTSTNVEEQMDTSYVSPFTDWVQQADPSSDVTRSIYFDMTIPSGATAGDYSTTLYINVTQYSS